MIIEYSMMWKKELRCLEIGSIMKLMKKITILSLVVFAILFGYFQFIQVAEAQSCTDNSDCPAVSSANYCDLPPSGDGNIWKDTQNRACDTEAGVCVNSGAVGSSIVSACSYGCSGSSCNPPPPTGTWSYPSACPTACGTAESNQTET